MGPFGLAVHRRISSTLAVARRTRGGIRTSARGRKPRRQHDLFRPDPALDRHFDMAFLQWGLFFAQSCTNGTSFFSPLSVLWSDFPFITFKRWFRDLGNYLAILVVLSDPRPLEAIRALLRRLSYLLIPLSILLVKYYPNGREYSIWTGPDCSGATTSKNMLGSCAWSARSFSSGTR